MRALSVVSNVIFIFSCAITVQAQPPAAPNAAQVTGCPTVLPVAEGERSIVVPSVAPHVEPPAQQAPHIASRPQSPQHEAAKSLLREKLAQRDQLQREITALQQATQTPEQISVQVKLYEINRTRLRKLNVDWSTFAVGKDGKFNAAELLGADVAKSETPGAFQVQTNVDPSFLKFLESLERSSVSRALGMPTVVVPNGRSASVLIGSEIPVPQPAGAAPRIEKIGTQVDLTAVTLGENRVRLELRPSLRELDSGNSPVVGGVQIPAVRIRQFDTAMEMELGTTTILSGLAQERTETKSDWLGRNNDEVQEVALLMVVTPQIVR